MVEYTGEVTEAQGARKGGPLVGKIKRGKGTKLMGVADGQGMPLEAELASASPHEVNLIEPLLAQIAVPRHGSERKLRRYKRRYHIERTILVGSVASVD